MWVGGIAPSSVASCSSRPPSDAKGRRRACCIGAGAAGLSCAKELIERGFEVTVLESRDGIGGVWRIDEAGQHVGVRREQRATSSKYYLGFSDFHIPDKAPDFVGHEEYLSYLGDYARHFGVLEHIRFGHRTKGLRRASSGAWEVDVEVDGRSQSLEFDAVAVCTGLHSEPDMPASHPGGAAPPPGFAARVVHARELKDAREALSGKRVVVVGGGETGAELAHLAAQVGARPAMMSLRRGVTVIGTYLPLPLGDRMPDARTPPVDLNERRFTSLLPHPLKHFVFTRDRDTIFGLRDENPGQHTVGRLVDRTLGGCFSLVALPFLVAGGIAADVCAELSHPLFWSADKPQFREPDSTEMSAQLAVATSHPGTPAKRLERDTAQLEQYTARAARFRMEGYTTWHYRQVRSLLEEFSGARHTQNFLTKSDDFIYDLMENSLQVRPGIQRYEGTNTVVFDDGSKAEADVVVLCTGYQPKVPFLKELLCAEAGSSSAGASERLDGQDLFKHVFHPRLGDSIAFVGFARPQLGAMPPIAEVQGRWFGAVLDGEASLPGKHEMEREMEADRSAYGEKVFSNRLRSSVDFAVYTTDIARRAGCLPAVGLSTMVKDFDLWWAFWFGPVLPQGYRMGDAGERGAVARQRVKDIYLTFFTRS